MLKEFEIKGDRALYDMDCALYFCGVQSVTDRMNAQDAFVDARYDLQAVIESMKESGLNGEEYEGVLEHLTDGLNEASEVFNAT